MSNIKYSSVKDRLDKVEEEIFEYYLNMSKNIDVIKKLYIETRSIGEEFLNQSFMGYKLEELEEIRYRILEQTLNLRIELCERLGLEKKEYGDKMKKMWGCNSAISSLKL